MFKGIVQRIHEIWNDDEEMYPVFPWLKEGTPSKIGVRQAGAKNCGEVWKKFRVNHVRNNPVLNLAHIHARGHGRLRTSEDYGELFDQVRETIGTRILLPLLRC